LLYDELGSITLAGMTFDRKRIMTSFFWQVSRYRWVDDNYWK